MRLTDMANGFLTKILQKCNFIKNMKKNNFVNFGDTDKKCQHPAGEGTQGASKIDRTFHFSNTDVCRMCTHAVYDMEYGSMYCRKHKECTREYYTCKYWIHNA